MVPPRQLVGEEGSTPSDAWLPGSRPGCKQLGRWNCFAEHVQQGAA